MEDRLEWKIGNIVWQFCGGAVFTLMWYLFGGFFYITYIGRPLARECFKIAKFVRKPFGRVVEQNGDYDFLPNVIWLFLFGAFWMLLYIALGGLFCCTLVGIPIGRVYLKMSALAAMPFGTHIEKGYFPKDPIRGYDRGGTW